MTIRIKNLNKSYRKHKALDSITVQLDSHVYGLMGPNGSGKTTFIRCLLNLIEYEGEIICNKKIKVGYLPQSFDVFKELTVYEQLEYFTVLKEIQNKKEEIDRVLNLVHLSEYKSKKCSELSGGMIRRIGIAQALLGSPDLVVFDEPTAGLDPFERNHFKNIIQNLNLDIPIIMATHIIEDINNGCTHALFFNKGKLVYSGSIEQLFNEVCEKVYFVPNEIIHTLNTRYIMRKQMEDKLMIITDKVVNGENVTKRDCDFEDLYHYVISFYDNNLLPSKE